MSEKQPGSFRLVLTLAAAGLTSGLVLVGVYLATLPQIQRNQAEALQRAIFQVLPGAARTQAFVLDGERLRPHEGPEGQVPDVEAIFAGFAADGRFIGYAIPADGPGFMDNIGLIYGYDPTRRVVVGMAVLESRETPGLGDKIISDAEFHENFAALIVEPSIVAVKKGAKQGANEVDCITGATISSEAVVSILNRSSERWVPLLEPPEDANEVADGSSSRR